MIHTIENNMEIPGEDNKLESKFNVYQIEAFKIIGDANLALQFQTPFSLCALKKLGKENIELALQFDNTNQLLALDELSKGHISVENVKLVLEFREFFQVEALKILGDANLALQFKEFFQVEALKILGDANLALRFKTLFSFDALKKLGKDNVELALQIEHYVQYEALNLVDFKLALKIKTPQQLFALSKLGSHCFDEVLKAEQGHLIEINNLNEACSTRLAGQDLDNDQTSSDI